MDVIELVRLILDTTIIGLLLYYILHEKTTLNLEEEMKTMQGHIGHLLEDSVSVREFLQHLSIQKYKDSQKKD